MIYCVLFFIIGVVTGYLIDKKKIEGVGVTLKTKFKEKVVRESAYISSPSKIRKMKMLKKELQQEL